MKPHRATVEYFRCAHPLGVRLVAAVLLVGMQCGCDQSSGGPAHTRIAESPAKLRILDSLFAKLNVELTIPPVTIADTANLRAVAEAKIKSLKLESSAFDKAAKSFRPLTSQELTSVAFPEPKIRLRGQAGVVIEHRAANGEYFRVAEILTAIEATELASRDRTEWFGGVDVHHIYFAFLQANEDGTWSIVWDS
jgi:hypothetical protein